MKKNINARKIQRVATGVLLPVTAPIVLLLFWQIAAMLTRSRLILPAPTEAVRELFRLSASFRFWHALSFSLLRCLGCFAIALLAALSLWTVSLRFSAVRFFLRPVVGMLRALPTASIILLLIIWTGSSSTPVAVALLIVLPLLYSSLWAAYGAIDDSLQETARLYGIPFLLRVSRIYLPLCAPSFLENAAGALSLNFKLILAAEVLAQTRDSFGLMMQQSQIYFETGRLLALTLVAVTVGLALESIVLSAARRTRY